MRLIPLTLLIAFFATSALPAAESGHASVSAILVIASNQRGPSDPRLAPYEANLKRTLRFESFRLAGEGSAAVAAGAKATLALPNNNRLQLEGESDGRGVRVKVSYGSTNVAIPPGGTVVIAGRPAGGNGEISAVIVMSN